MLPSVRVVVVGGADEGAFGRDVRLSAVFLRRRAERWRSVVVVVVRAPVEEAGSPGGARRSDEHGRREGLRREVGLVRAAEQESAGRLGEAGRRRADGWPADAPSAEVLAMRGSVVERGGRSEHRRRFGAAQRTHGPRLPRVLRPVVRLPHQSRVRWPRRRRCGGDRAGDQPVRHVVVAVPRAGDALRLAVRHPLAARRSERRPSRALPSREALLVAGRSAERLRRRHVRVGRRHRHRRLDRRRRRRVRLPVVGRVAEPVAFRAGPSRGRSAGRGRRGGPVAVVALRRRQHAVAAGRKLVDVARDDHRRPRHAPPEEVVPVRRLAGERLRRPDARRLSTAAPRRARLHTPITGNQGWHRLNRFHLN